MFIDYILIVCIGTQYSFSGTTTNSLHLGHWALFLYHSFNNLFNVKATGSIHIILKHT